MVALLVLIGLIGRAPGLRAHERISTSVTFNREVVRIVSSRCLPCHGPDGKAVPLLRYAEARPWAKAIRDEVLTGRMPPWPPRPGSVALANDRSLSRHQVALLVDWAEGGAPEGAASDRPLTTAPAASSVELPAGVPVVRVAVERRLPMGGLLHAVRPLGPRGASIEVRVIGPDASQRPILWIPSFDPRYAYAYQLRVPLALEPGARVRVFGPARARVDLSLSPLAPTSSSPAPPVP